MSETNTNAGNPATSSPPREKPETTPKKRPWLGTVITLVLLLVLVSLLFTFLHHPRKPTPPPPPVQVSTTNATQGDIGIYVSALGSVIPIATVTIASQVTGQLTNVNFVEGQMVKAGDLLAQIDERPFQATLTSAEGTLERDKAMLEGVQVDYKRYLVAAGQNAIPKQTLDDELATLHQDEGTVKYDQGQVDNAKVQLNYCRIVSPISGRVGLRLVDPGNLVQATSTNGLAVITQLQPITVVFSVAEDYLPQIQRQLKLGNHMSVEAYDRAQQKKIATGSVLALDNQIDTATGTIRLKSIFTNEDLALFPNQFVNVKLLIDTLRGKTLIPTSAIQRGANSAFVYVVKHGGSDTNSAGTNASETVQMQTIKTHVTDGDTTAVEGIDPGVTIATDNFNRLQDGAKITVRKPVEAGAGTNGTNNATGNRGKNGKGAGRSKE